MPNPLRNRGYEEIIRFLEHCGCSPGPIHGDDQIFYHPNNKNWGIKVNINPTLKRSGYPIGTLLANIRSLRAISGIEKKEWIKWFSEKRNF